MKNDAGYLHPVSLHDDAKIGQYSLLKLKTVICRAILLKQRRNGASICFHARCYEPQNTLSGLVQGQF